MPSINRLAFPVLLSAFALLTQGAPAASLKKAGEFALPGPPGKRFDYLTVEPSRHLLLCAHMGAGQLYFIDTGTNTVVGTVPELPLIEGIECVPELGKAYCSTAGDDSIAVVDMKEMKVVKRLKTEGKPDGSTYAAPFHQLFVSDETGHAVAIVDVTRDEIIKTLHFDSETGMPQYDPIAKLVYVNLQDKNVLAAIDPATNEVFARYPVMLGEANHGMALDPKGRRAFLGCEGNSKLVVFDLEKHLSVAAISVPDGIDVVKYDEVAGRVYAACYSGAIAVIARGATGEYELVETVAVPKKVHSLAVDPETHRVYAPAQADDAGKPSSQMLMFDAEMEKVATNR